MKKFMRSILFLIGAITALVIFTAGFYFGSVLVKYVYISIMAQGLSTLLILQIIGGVFFGCIFSSLAIDMVKLYNDNKGE